MIGIVIGIIIGIGHVLAQKSAEFAFISCTNFLWKWYWIWTIVSIIPFLFIILMTLGGFAFAAEKMDSSPSKVALFLGFAGFNGAVGIICVLFSLSRILLLIGVHLLNTAGTAEIPFSQFSIERLVLGGAFLLIGLYISRPGKKRVQSSASEKTPEKEK